MITITRRLAKQIKSVFRQALSLKLRGTLPVVRLVGGPDGLRVRCQNGQAAAEFSLEGEQPLETLDVAFHLLTEIEGTRDTPVQIESRDGKITATWRDGSVPQLVQYEAASESTDTWPPTPTEFAENPPGLLTALHDAAQTTDTESTRYALGCIQFRGDHGELVATDAHQILLQGGFTFPWQGDVLVPASKLFGSRQLPADEPVFVGRAKDWAVFRIDNWTFWQAIETEARFPDVTSHFRQPSEASASCQIPEADRSFLIDNLPRLPVDDALNQSVTVDLNGSVAVRGKQADPEACTELVLSAATRTGKVIRFNSNRRYLQRAAQLGLENLHIFGKESPALACDDRRKYLWALLDSKESIKAADVTLRMESASSETEVTIPSQKPQQRPKTTMSTTSVNKQTGNGQKAGRSKSAQSTGKSQSQETSSLSQASQLYESLRAATKQAGELVRAIKAEKRKSKLVRSTLASLRSLEALEA